MTDDNRCRKHRLRIGYKRRADIRPAGLLLDVAAAVPHVVAAMPTFPSAAAPSSALKEIFSTGKVYDESGSQVELSSNVSEGEAALLHAAVRELRPAASVEIGFAQGISALAILDAVKQNGLGHHHVIDPFQRNYGNAGREMVNRAGLSAHYSFHEAFIEDVFAKLPRLQFAFIDSSHLFDLTVCEFVLVDKKLDVGGVVGLHDMWMPSQQAFIRYLLANRAYEVWHPAGGELGKPPRAAGWKRAFRALARRVPAAERVFSADFLKPWEEFDLGNLMFVRKMANDSRDWRYHQRF